MVKFLIDHLDPLGQGVSKRTDAKKRRIVTFIPKTLPGEQGNARILKTAKSVEFAEIINISSASPQRIEPECPHFSRCSGCDYQHVSYADELTYKKSALLFLLRSINLGACEIEIIPAPSRFFYRNRIQLHYRHKYIGFVDASADSILEVPECRLMSSAVKVEVDKIYIDRSWKKKYKGRGHVEIYEKESGVSTNWNESYANGGFTQVNSEMNIQLKNWLRDRFISEKYTTILDIFSGGGNLSDALIFSEDISRVMVDSCESVFSHKKNSIFIRMNLLLEDALEKFTYHSNIKKTDVLLLDPPRTGFYFLPFWNKKLNPEYIIYVSCNPATLSRDILELMKSDNKLKIENVVLVDMFPCTSHFETVIILRR